LGISVKGGAEHGIPVLISRVFPGQAGILTCTKFCVANSFLFQIAVFVCIRQKISQCI